MLVEQLKLRNNFTFQESNLADYILAHPNEILKMNIRELGKASLTSSATILRLCKKLNLKGYSDFKVIYASECLYYDRIKPKHITLESANSYVDTLDYTFFMYIKEFNEFNRNINKEVLSHSIHIVNERKKIMVHSKIMNEDFLEMMMEKINDKGIDFQWTDDIHHFKSNNALNIIVSSKEKCTLSIDIVYFKDNILMKFPLLKIDLSYCHHKELLMLYVLDLICINHKSK